MTCARFMGTCPVVVVVVVVIVVVVVVEVEVVVVVVVEEDLGELFNERGELVAVCFVVEMKGWLVED